MKSMLLHVQDSEDLVARVEAALALARCFSAHLHCLHVTPVEAYAAVGTFDGALLLPDLSDALADAAARVQERVEGELAREDVSWSYEAITASVADALARHSALADLVVSGRMGAAGTLRNAPQVGLIGDYLENSRTPLYLHAGEERLHRGGQPVVVAWDGSMEAANAVRRALPFLKQATSVNALRLEPEVSEDDFPDTRLCEYLSRHGIAAELRLETASHHDRAMILVGISQELDAAAIVMGAYSRSRLGQFLFGGMTRTLLHDCTVPLLLAR